MNDLATLLPILLIVVLFYFLLIRPQRRRQQEMAHTQGALEIGTEVMLGSGIFGRVASLEDETIHLEVAPGATVKVARQAVVRVITPEGPVTDLDAAPDDAHDPETPDDPAHPGR